MAALRERTYRRIVDPETSTSGISRRIRIQIWCAVCRCFLGALRSDSRIALINLKTAVAGQKGGCLEEFSGPTRNDSGHDVVQQGLPSVCRCRLLRNSPYMA